MNSRFYLGETKDYSKFNFVESNREISQANLSKIEKSILEIGIQVPIVVDDTYSIIEGQHRFVALKNNNLVVPYIVSSVAKETEIAKLQESKKWTALDYCKSLAKLGNDDCIKALAHAQLFHERSNGKLSLILSLELLKDGPSHSVLKFMKNGKYKVNVDAALNVFEAALVMSKYESGTSPFGNKIARALKKLHYEYNGLKMPAIAKMAENNYIMAYSNETDQLEYMRKKYSRYARKRKAKS